MIPVAKESARNAVAAVTWHKIVACTCHTRVIAPDQSIDTLEAVVACSIIKCLQVHHLVCDDMLQGTNQDLVFLIAEDENQWQHDVTVGHRTMSDVTVQRWQMIGGAVYPMKMLSVLTKQTSMPRMSIVLRAVRALSGHEHVAVGWKWWTCRRRPWNLSHASSWSHRMVQNRPTACQKTSPLLLPHLLLYIGGNLVSWFTMSSCAETGFDVLVSPCTSVSRGFLYFVGHCMMPNLPSEAVLPVAHIVWCL